MYVTRHSSLTDRRLTDRLWDLYESAYTEVSYQSPSHEMRFRDEFERRVMKSPESSVATPAAV